MKTSDDKIFDTLLGLKSDVSAVHQDVRNFSSRVEKLEKRYETCSARKSYHDKKAVENSQVVDVLQIGSTKIPKSLWSSIRNSLAPMLLALIVGVAATIAVYIKFLR